MFNKYVTFLFNILDLVLVLVPGFANFTPVLKDKC